ncbi:sigma-70 family RNA polymerase sigma factor [Luteolibacter sp. GHJ8]|uniref:Sigma-70 family RNA polymerase sigma factor n=1 Tax=Luteolibacter rhizosphaerae TaxID=2989719 RepID=A0ABT3FZQ1_9BACT|nr:sigma-70 family RNA polymerase sigma factor [Luteolibacter rhizosphaerae]MCW1912719.1 sigma-70 family RNA polymerase sigma factor [Luteolibacter rhizosphaerae]
MNPSPPTDDFQLLDRFLKAKDQRAFALLMERHLPLVYSVALRVTGQPQLAQEIGQDVFLKLVRKPPTSMKRIPLAVWLHRATRCRAIDMLRSERRREARERAVAAEPAAGAQLDEEALACLDEVIDRLPESERHLVVGRFFLGQSFPELSSRTGASEDAIRMRLNRSLEKMRVSFSRQGITTTAAILARALPAQALTIPPRGMAASILKSVSAVGVGAAAPGSFLSSLYLMTSIQKYTIGGVLLLAAAIPVAIQIQQGQDPHKTDSGTPPVAHSSALPSAPETKRKAEKSERTPRSGLEGEFAALAEKYGESEARQARSLASQSARLVRQIGSMEGLKEKLGAGVKQEIELLAKELGLDAGQQATIEAMGEEAISERITDLGRVATRTEENLPALAEVFLALDAVSRGKIDEAAFKDALHDKVGKLSLGNTSVLELIGLVGVRAVYKAQDPFASSPELSKRFAEQLDSERRLRYQDIRDTNAANAAEFPELTRRNLEAISSNITGMGKIFEAMEMMDTEAIRSGK